MQVPVIAYAQDSCRTTYEMENEETLQSYGVALSDLPKPVIKVADIEFRDGGSGYGYSPSSCKKFASVVYVKIDKTALSESTDPSYFVKLVEGSLPDGVSLPDENDLLGSPPGDLYFPLTMAAVHNPIQPFTLQVTPVVFRLTPEKKHHWLCGGKSPAHSN